jgi:hypothetical protein
MGKGGEIGGNCVVCQVGCGFGGTAEEGRGFAPPHGENQGDRDELAFAVPMWEEHGQLGDVLGAKPDAVKPIRNVHFGHVHRAEAGVAVEDFLQQTQ